MYPSDKVGPLHDRERRSGSFPSPRLESDCFELDVDGFGSSWTGSAAVIRRGHRARLPVGLFGPQHRHRSLGLQSLRRHGTQRRCYS